MPIRKTEGSALRAPDRAGLADPRETVRAWEAFLEGRCLKGPDKPRARAVIMDSWKRSARAGVEADRLRAPLQAGEDALDRQRRRNADLLAAADAALGYIGRLLDGAAAMMVLTDREGLILRTVGDRETLEEGREIHLEEGGVWSEACAGTNGIGTALWTGKPTFVHGEEHFCSGIKRWTCAGAPIHDPIDQTVLGVLDLSGPTGIFKPHNTAMVAAAARHVERALAERKLDERGRLLELCLAPERRLDPEAGLMILDVAGRVLFARNAPERLDLGGRSCDVTIGRKLGDLPEGEIDAALAAALPKRGVAEVDALKLDGELRGALVVFENGRARRRQSATRAETADRGAPGPAASRAALDPAEPEIVGDSAGLREAVEFARSVAAGEISVLFQGETGVGKELFARLVYAASGRARTGDFVAMNCGAIAPELFGGELFGHVPGAFTGAAPGGRPGKLELAANGVLCLDEIGEMPLEMQAYLLRVLEERKVSRLGENRERDVTARILGMTNRNLAEDVAAGRFRRDLFYRVGAVTVQIPPLRERGDDALLLLDHFNAMAASRLDLGPLRFTAPAVELLARYAWPGNVRELKNLVDMLHLVCRDREVRPGALPVHIREPTRPAAEPAATAALSCAASFEEAERAVLVKALRAAEGNASRAAAELGVSRATLYRKMRLLGLRRETSIR